MPSHLQNDKTEPRSHWVYYNRLLPNRLKIFKTTSGKQKHKWITLQSRNGDRPFSIQNPEATKDDSDNIVLKENKTP